MYKLTIYKEKISPFEDEKNILYNHCMVAKSEFLAPNILAMYLVSFPSEDVISYLGLLVRADFIVGFKLKKFG